MLDEPSNMLDVQAVLWLEEYLRVKWKKTLLIVSHDRQFLNYVVTDIIHLSERNLVSYTGNYDQFEQTRTIPIMLCIPRLTFYCHLPCQ